jgi:hypothetical protein
MNMVEEYPVRRKHARLTFGEPASGAITSSNEVQVLELSLGGARIEHTMILHPGSSCYLRLPLSVGILTANCIIIWSRVVDRAVGEQGGSALLFHTGVQFGNLAREAQALLDAYLQGRSE